MDYSRVIRVLEFNKIINRLAEFSCSSLGKTFIENLSPSIEFEEVLRWQKETSDAVDFISKKGNPPIAGTSDIRQSTKRVRMDAILTPLELLKISSVLFVSRNLKSFISQDKDSENTISNCIKILNTNKRLEEKIKMSIESEDTIADSASNTLLNIRRQIRDSQNSIKEKLNSILHSSKYQKYMQESIVTMRGDRYVIPVKQEYRSDFPGLIHDSSSSGATIFIEPLAVVEANNNIRQLKIKEEIEIERILQELTLEVSTFVDELDSNVEVLGNIDFLISKARYSFAIKGISPILNSNGKINIKNGRHPLINPKDVVPIDFIIGDEVNTLIITGPNTGGKTVTLKTCGLLTLMAQAGLHIPASDGTQMSIFDGVYSDIGDEQSIEQSLSTFSSHMKNIVEILKSATSNSLVLFDELGAGTDPTEGAALAVAILESLKSKNIKTVATTHYSELKMYALTTKHVINACCEFNVETLKPTYKLLIGVPGKSNAFAISKKLGLTDDILDMAKEYLSKEDLKFEDVLLNIENNRRKTEKELDDAQNYKMQIENLKKQLEIKEKKVNNEKDRIIRLAKEEAKRVLQSAKFEAEGIVENIKQLRNQQIEGDTLRQAEELRNKIRGSVRKLNDDLNPSIIKDVQNNKPPEKLIQGQKVLVLNLNMEGTVVNPPDNNGDTLVQIGIMKVNVNISNLKLIDEQKQIVNKFNVNKVKTNQNKGISFEKDLRGMLLDDAIESIDKYLDDCYLSGLNEVVLIHGKGTGVLRTGIHQFLKRHPHVKTYRLGKFGEGEAGVTVVEIN